MEHAPLSTQISSFDAVLGKNWLNTKLVSPLRLAPSEKSWIRHYLYILQSNLSLSNAYTAAGRASISDTFGSFQSIFTGFYNGSLWKIYVEA